MSRLLWRLEERGQRSLDSGKILPLVRETEQEHVRETGVLRLLQEAFEADGILSLQSFQRDPSGRGGLQDDNAYDAPRETSVIALTRALEFVECCLVF